MEWRKPKSRYESEVHLGFMAIIVLLLLLNLVTNVVVYKARSAQQDETSAQLRLAAIAISRLVQAEVPAPLAPDALDRAREQYGLSTLTIIPVQPADQSSAAMRDWFRTVTRKFPPTGHPGLADRLYRANINELTRGYGSEYYYLYPIPAGAGGNLLVLTTDRTDLAYLDDSREMLMIMLLASVGVAGIIYVFLFRFLFRPFRRIKKQAERAGRVVDDAEDDIEAVVAEYERIIGQLTATKTELERANIEISGRADALELFNSCLMESSHSGVITLNLAGEVLAANDIALSLLEIGENSPAGCNYRDLLVERPAIADDIAQALQSEAAPRYREYSGLIEDQPNTVLGVTLTDIRDQEHGITGLLLIINDLTELSRLRIELEGRNRLAALGEMAGGLAHQIRNSLGAISGFGTLVKRRLKGEGRNVEPVESLLEESKEAGELITRFLSFARPFEYAPFRIDLGDLLDECLESQRMRLSAPTCELIFSPRETVWVEADSVLLKQAIGNVLDNAIKAIEPGPGTVTVSLTVESDRAEIVIQDSGCGIPADELDKIFTPFFSSRPSGTGLGLPLAAKIVDLHAGKIEVQSELGRGTRFTLSLPCLETEPEARSRSKISEQI
jgi:signal transduction histidine kinase